MNSENLSNSSSPTSARARGNSQLYFVPKARNMSLDTAFTSISTLKSPEIEASQGKLMVRISQLESINRKYKAKVARLEATVSDLENELRIQKENNITMLNQSDASGGSVHSLYQSLFVTDVKQEMSKLNNDMKQYRNKSNEHQQQMQDLRRSHFQMQATVKRYRNILSSTIKGAATPVNLNTTPDPKKPNIPNISSIRQEDLEILLLITKQLNHARNMHRICSILTIETRKLLNAEHVTVFNIDDKVMTLYHQALGNEYVYTGRVKIESRWVDIHAEPGTDTQLPEFDKFSDLNYPVRQKEMLLMGVKVKEGIVMAIQCQGKGRAKRKEYTIIDELMLKAIINVAAVKIELMLVKSQEKISRLQAIDIAQIASEISSSTSHADIANKVYKHLPDYFGFEKCGIVFSEVQGEGLFSMLHEPGTEDYYTEGVMRYMPGTGLSGDAMQNAATKLYLNPKRFGAYNPEIDNNAGAFDVKNILIVPLKNYKSTVIGSLQLINSKTGEIPQRTIQRVESFMKLIGASIYSANRAIEMVAIVHGSINLIKAISSTLGKIDVNDTVIEIGLLYNQVESIKNNMESWLIDKKHKFLKTNLPIQPVYHVSN